MGEGQVRVRLLRPTPLPLLRNRARFNATFKNPERVTHTSPEGEALAAFVETDAPRCWRGF